MTISTPLDTLKTLAQRCGDELDYVIDQLAGGEADIPEHLLDMLDGVKQMIIEGVGEHLPLVEDPHFPSARKVLPAAAYYYDDGSPVAKYFETEGVRTKFYPRYQNEDEIREYHLAGAQQKNRLSLVEEKQELSDVAVVLIETDLATLIEAQKHNDLSLIRLKDGERPSEEQLALIMQATKEHLQEASEEMCNRAVRSENAAWASQRSLDLMQKYNAQAGESLEEVALRMSVEDREEILSLGRILADTPMEEGSER